jgi:lysophospholipase L1-like esterase
MPLLSRNLPAFASPGGDANLAKDADNNSTWTSSGIPAWLAYDVSSVSDAAKQQALVAIYAERANDYVAEQIAPWQMPIDYTIEVNSAPGGGSPPASGWTIVASKTNNTLAAPQHLVSLAGENWVRVNVTRSSDPGAVALDVDLYSAPAGATDDWLFLGDSITAGTFQRLFENLNQRVNDRDASRWPAQIGGGIGGTNTTTALGTIDARLAEFPGRYVVLGYGTNDHPAEYHMEELVQKVIAAGKTPVVPHIPWSTGTSIETEGPQMNAIIDGLYQKYPQILRGPDLWTLLADTAYIPAGDVHPTEAGRQVILDAYASIM